MWKALGSVKPRAVGNQGEPVVLSLNSLGD